MSEQKQASVKQTMPALVTLPRDSNRICHCNEPAVYICSGCNMACYCSKECQERYWEAHRKLCVMPIEEAMHRVDAVIQEISEAEKADKEHVGWPPRGTVFGTVVNMWTQTTGYPEWRSTSDKHVATLGWTHKLLAEPDADNMLPEHALNLVLDINGERTATHLLVKARDAAKAVLSEIRKITKAAVIDYNPLRILLRSLVEHYYEARTQYGIISSMMMAPIGVMNRTWSYIADRFKQIKSYIEEAVSIAVKVVEFAFPEIGEFSAAVWNKLVSACSWLTGLITNIAGLSIEVLYRGCKKAVSMVGTLCTALYHAMGKWGRLLKNLAMLIGASSYCTIMELAIHLPDLVIDSLESAKAILLTVTSAAFGNIYNSLRNSYITRAMASFAKNASTIVQTVWGESRRAAIGVVNDVLETIAVWLRIFAMSDAWAKRAWSFYTKHYDSATETIIDVAASGATLPRPKNSAAGACGTLAQAVTETVEMKPSMIGSLLDTLYKAFDYDKYLGMFWEIALPALKEETGDGEVLIAEVQRTVGTVTALAPAIDAYRSDTKKIETTVNTRRRRNTFVLIVVPILRKIDALLTVIAHVMTDLDFDMGARDLEDAALEARWANDRIGVTSRDVAQREKNMKRLVDAVAAIPDVEHLVSSHYLRRLSPEALDDIAAYRTNEMHLATVVFECVLAPHIAWSGVWGTYAAAQKAVGSVYKIVDATSDVGARTLISHAAVAEAIKRVTADSARSPDVEQWAPWKTIDWTSVNKLAKTLDSDATFAQQVVARTAVDAYNMVLALARSCPLLNVVDQRMGLTRWFELNLNVDAIVGSVQAFHGEDDVSSSGFVWIAEFGAELLYSLSASVVLPAARGVLRSFKWLLRNGFIARATVGKYEVLLKTAFTMTRQPVELRSADVLVLQRLGSEMVSAMSVEMQNFLFTDASNVAVSTIRDVATGYAASRLATCMVDAATSNSIDEAVDKMSAGIVDIGAMYGISLGSKEALLTFVPAMGPASPVVAGLWYLLMAGGADKPSGMVASFSGYRTAALLRFASAFRKLQLRGVLPIPDVGDTFVFPASMPFDGPMVAELVSASDLLRSKERELRHERALLAGDNRRSHGERVETLEKTVSNLHREFTRIEALVLGQLRLVKKNDITIARATLHRWIRDHERAERRCCLPSPEFGTLMQSVKEGIDTQSS